jgi:hypothetical protein
MPMKLQAYSLLAVVCAALTAFGIKNSPNPQGELGAQYSIPLRAGTYQLNAFGETVGCLLVNRTDIAGKYQAVGLVNLLPLSSPDIIPVPFDLDIRSDTSNRVVKAALEIMGGIVRLKAEDPLSGRLSEGQDAVQLEMSGQNIGTYSIFVSQTKSYESNTLKLSSDNEALGFTLSVLAQVGSLTGVQWSAMRDSSKPCTPKAAVHLTGLADELWNATIKKQLLVNMGSS